MMSWVRSLVWVIQQGRCAGAATPSRAENRYRIVAGLHLYHRKVYGPGIEPRRRAGS